MVDTPRNSTGFSFDLNPAIGFMAADPRYGTYVRPSLSLDFHLRLGEPLQPTPQEDVDQAATAQGVSQFGLDLGYGAVMRGFDTSTAQQFLRVAAGYTRTQGFYREDYPLHTRSFRVGLAWAPAEATRLYPELTWREWFGINKTNGLGFNYALSAFTCLDVREGFCGIGGQFSVGAGFDWYTSLNH